MRSRSATERRSATSSGLDLCSLSHPNLSQSLKLLLIADQKEFRTSDDSCDEVLSLGKVYDRIPPWSIRRGVHLASEFTLPVAHRGNYVHERNISNHHKIYVAVGGFGSSRHGTKDEGDFNAAPQFGKCVRQDLGETEGLSNKPAELVEDLAMLVSLEVRLPTFEHASENAGAGQLFKLSLDGAGARIHGLDDLPLIESLIGMPEEQSENGSPRCPEECVRW